MSVNTGNEYEGNNGGRSEASSRGNDMPFASVDDSEYLPY